MMARQRQQENDDEEQTIRSEADSMWAEGMSFASHWRLARVGHFHPPTDVYETDDAVVVTVEIAGLEEKDYEISLSNRALTIKGARRGPAEKLTYQQMEIQYGEFHTRVLLPCPVQENAVEASYARGFLRVELRKAQARRVPITNKDT